jgi:hypothetical protein
MSPEVDFSPASPEKNSVCPTPHVSPETLKRNPPGVQNYKIIT